MSVKKLRHRHLSKKDRKKHEQEMAARLAPLEEIHASQQPNGAGGDDAYHDGSIRVDSRSVKLAADLAGEDRKGARIFHLEPVVIVILLIMLSFIGFIAWQITLMEPPAK